MQFHKSRKFSLSLVDHFKKRSKTMCFKCFESDGVANFFVEGTGLNQHFRTMHRNTDVDDSKCKALFQKFHGEETATVVEQLSRLRLQKVSLLFYFLTDKKTNPFSMSDR